MKRLLQAAALCLTISVLVIPSIPAHASGIAAKKVLNDGNFPAAFTFGPNGALYFADRFSGEIRLKQTASTSRLVFTVTNLSTVGEQGLLGIALDPNYPSSPYLYAYATRDTGTLENEILKITIAGGVGTGFTVIWSSPTDTINPYHDGGHILFGPDGKLYAQVGEGHDSSNAQDLSNDMGKTLRMNSNGNAPGDNPLGGRIFTRGMRNGFGFTFDPVKHRLWETENGPECNDEVNQFNNGNNGGWGPNENCSGTSPGDTNNSGPTPRQAPKWWTTPTIAPTGVAFCPANGCGLTGRAGHMFFGSYNDAKIREVRFTASRTGILSGWPKIALNRSDGILSMERNPVNHHLYFSDRNGIYELVAA
jgi:glucose/arabinose dehydrogenase